VTIEKIKGVRRRTSRGFVYVKEALRKYNGDVDEAVKY
jgi:translation elongation factor EF-Ts